MVLKCENNLGMKEIIVDESNLEELFEEIRSCVYNKSKTMILESRTVRDINNNELFTMRFAYNK